MKSKFVNTIGLVIGLSPVIQSGIENLPSGNIHNMTNQIVDGYTAGLSSGSFDFSKAARWYGPIVGAILFKKVMSKLKGKTLLD